MAVTLLRSAGEFLEQTQDFRAQYPFELNLIGSVASSIAFNGRKYDEYFWWIIKDPQGSVVGVAMRTAPHGMVLSPMSIESAAELAAQVARHDDALPEIGGLLNELDYFLHAYRKTGSNGSHRPVEISSEELFYTLGKLILPEVLGESRVATDDDFELILEWMKEFAEESGAFIPDPVESIKDGLSRGSYNLWLDNGLPVSLAGHASIVEIPGGLVGRIGPVFTPPIYRGRGYAAAVTAAVSERLQALGAHVMLFTDATNATSNGVYKRIGFEVLGHMQRRKFLAG